jgi:hypothetical protein
VALICLVTGALKFGLYEFRNNIFNQQSLTGKKSLPTEIYYEKSASFTDGG